MTSSHQQGKTGQLSGHVITTEGQAVSDAAVMLTGESPPHKDIAALTDAHGRFSFDDLLPGMYTVLVNAEGYPPHTKDIMVSPSKTARITFVLASESEP